MIRILGPYVGLNERQFMKHVKKLKKDTIDHEKQHQQGTLFN